MQALATQFDRVKLVADGISYVGSGKTLSDHALSHAAGADCKILNVALDAPICSTVSPDGGGAAITTGQNTPEDAATAGSRGEPQAPGVTLPPGASL